MLIGSKVSESDASSGMALVWSKINPNTPEFIFTSSSPVLVCRQLPESNLVIGGCYNGQILLWEMKTSTTLPMVRSNIAGRGHKHPIVNIFVNFIPTKDADNNSYEVFSVSSDGLICHWDIHKLSDPLECFQLTPTNNTNPSLKMPSLVVSTIQCDQDESLGRFYVIGTSTGQLLRYYPKNNTYHMLEQGHQGLVTAIDIHPSQSSSKQQLYKNLFLSCSLDWSIKLIHNKTCLISFPSTTYEYLADVKWCPMNPFVFACLSSNGELLVYHLLKSITELIMKISLSKIFNEKKVGIASSAWNRFHWSKDGKIVFLGDAKGCLYSLDVHESLILRQPGDETKFELVMVSLHQHNQNVDKIE